MTSDRKLRANGMVVNSLSAAIRNGEADLANVPGLICALVDADGNGPWKSFETQLGEHVSPASFEELVITSPLAGLGCSSVDQLRGLCNGDTVEDRTARDRIDAATRREGGRPPLTGNNIPSIPRPEGTSEAKALRRLRKDRPDLHERVLAGELKAHAAMIEAGFRPRTATIRLDDPASTERTLRKHMSPEDLADLVRRLTQPVA
jgi:hypothetical protein